MMARNISPVVFTCLYLLLEKSIDFTGGDNNQSRISCLSGADLGGGCRGCAPPPLEMKLSSSYIRIRF